MASRFRSHRGPAKADIAPRRKGAPTLLAASRLLPCLLLFSGLAIGQSVSFPDFALNPNAEAPPRAPATWRPRQDYSVVGIPLEIRAPALSAPESTLPPKRRRGPTAIGVGRPVPSAHQGDLRGKLVWSNIDGGAIAAALQVASPGAKALRIALSANLPEGGEVRFFSPADSSQRFRPRHPKEFAAGKGGTTASTAAPPTLLWSPTVTGETIGVEVTLPAQADLQSFALEVRRISHLQRTPVQPAPVAPPQPADTHNTCTAVDVSCAAAPSCAALSTVRILFTEADGNSYACTATLINDSRETEAKLRSTHLLTAHHCISSQAAAKTVETWWNYQTASCGSSQRSDRFFSLDEGADLVVTHARTDHSLLRLRAPVPQAPICWKGWSSSSAQVGENVYSVHHPRGEFKEWAAGQITDHGVTVLVDNEDQEVESFVVDFHTGALVGGSSGAALSTEDNNHLIGVLSGGPEDDCSVNHYGRFDRFIAVAGRWLGAETVDAGGTLDDYGNDIASATGVLLSSTTKGDLETPDDIDFFRISIPEDGRLFVRTEGSTDTLGTLFSASGVVISSDDDDGSSGNFRIVVNLRAGTYYISVAGYTGSHTGSYTLFVDFQREVRTVHSIPLLPAASNSSQQGFVRIVNRSRTDGSVQLTAIDDAGTAQDPIMLAIPSRRTLHFNSEDLEQGNPQKGLSDGIGAGTGDWRLELVSSLDLRPQAYARTEDGFITSLHGLAGGKADAHYVSFFNGANNTRLRSLLRLINPNNRSVEVTIEGRDDQGQPAPRGRVSLRLAPRAAMRITAQQLEMGDAAFDGRLGDGDGKWQLFIEASAQIQAMSLIETAAGRLSNVSTVSDLEASN